MKNKRVLFMTEFAILLAIEAIFCFTPLGSLPAFGPIVATLAMVPICITAILMGTGAGSLMGFMGGLFSFMVWTFMPPSPVMAFVFTPFYSINLADVQFQGNFGSLLICFVPRILTGTVTGLLYRLLSKRQPKGKILKYALSAAVGSMVNTLGVMGGVWLFFGDQYSGMMGTAMIVIIGTTILTSGIPEAIVAAIAASAVCRPIETIMEKSFPKG